MTTQPAASAWTAAGHVLGKAWNAPNTLLGLVYGALGMLLGLLAHALGRQPRPRVRWRDNAVQFTYNPFGGVGALTLGNTTTWIGDPYDPDDHTWDAAARREGHPMPDHERQHTYQGELLGPFYLPSNILGGLNALVRGEGWHGPHNWNERGPQSNPPRPWAPLPPPIGRRR